jgi:hypothetical protein
MQPDRDMYPKYTTEQGPSSKDTMFLQQECWQKTYFSRVRDIVSAKRLLPIISNSMWSLFHLELWSGAKIYGVRAMPNRALAPFDPWNTKFQI